MDTSKSRTKRAIGAALLALSLGFGGALALATPAGATTARCDGMGRHVYARATSGGGVTIENCSLSAIRVSVKVAGLGLTGWSDYWTGCRTIKARQSSHWTANWHEKYYTTFKYC